jgi:uncharacterized protein (TIGR02246 family)
MEREQMGMSVVEEQASAEAGIRRFNESVTEAFNRQDAATMAGFWTEQARLMPPGEEILVGRSAVQAYWQSVFDQGAYQAELVSIEIRSLGEGVAYEIGTNVVKMRLADGSSVDVRGKSMCVFRREGEVWRADIDIFNVVEGK